MKEELHQALNSLASAYAEPNIKEDGLARFMIVGKKARAYGMIQKAIDKLGQLEDLEDKIGIDLITLFKALEDGAWFKIGNRFYTDRPNLIRDIGQFTLQVPYHGFVNVKDYGKTWALTKEELE